MSNFALKKIIISIISFFLILIFSYLIYVFSSYSRFPDKMQLNTQGDASKQKILVGTKYRITSANLGFGAYNQSFSFFMDGGKYSWAFSKEDVIKNITGSISSILKTNPNFIVLQEIDFDSTRSHHVDERKIIYEKLNQINDKKINTIFAQNYDSAFLFWPLNQPHGSNKSGILTATEYKCFDSIRRSYPIETGFSKFFDLDRCYLKTYIEVDNGKKLVLYNTHMSAYTKNAETTTKQIEMLNEDMMEEYNKGNYIVCGGDLNREVMKDMSTYFGFTANGENWSKTFPIEKLSTNIKLIPPVNLTNPIPSVRDTNKEWDKTNFVTTIDGFIVSDNVQVEYADALDNDFMFSDHNPIYMDFILN